MSLPIRLLRPAPGTLPAAGRASRRAAAPVARPARTATTHCTSLFELFERLQHLEPLERGHAADEASCDDRDAALQAVMRMLRSGRLRTRGGRRLAPDSGLAPGPGASTGAAPETTSEAARRPDAPPRARGRA